MKLRHTLFACLFSVLAVGAVHAGEEPFKTEVDCDGLFAPGAVVPYLIEIEDRVFQTHEIDFTLEIDIPSMGSRTLRQGSYTITPNETTFIDLTLGLPDNAPNGRYTFMVTGVSASHTSIDTCSFHVQ